MSFSIALSHVGLYVTDMPRMVDFYTRFMGFVVSDRSERWNDNEIVFLTRDPVEHHQVVLASGRPGDLPFNVVNQLSFRVDSLDTLKAMHDGLCDEAVSDVVSLTHGNALSVYFRDPERNRIELLIDTPWHIPQPYRVPVDLSLPEETLWAQIEQHVRKEAGFKSRDIWAAEMRRRIAQADAERLAVPH